MAWQSNEIERNSNTNCKCNASSYVRVAFAMRILHVFIEIDSGRVNVRVRSQSNVLVIACVRHARASPDRLKQQRQSNERRSGRINVQPKIDCDENRTYDSLGDTWR